jgi:hypothetical protein
MQTVADDLANQFSKAKFVGDDKKALLSVFFHKTPKDKAFLENKKKEFVDLLEENDRELRQIDLGHVVDLTAAQKTSYLHHKEALELEKLLPPSQFSASRPVNSTELKLARQYVRDIASRFLEEDEMMEPNQSYISGQHPLPFIRSSLLNTKQSNERDIQVQKRTRPGDLVTINTPILERPLKNLRQKVTN